MNLIFYASNSAVNLSCPHRGVVARALHLTRGVEKPSGKVTYIVVLEGLCRFSVQELSTRGTYDTARITSLDMTKSGKFIFVCICVWLFIFLSLLLFLIFSCVSY